MDRSGYTPKLARAKTVIMSGIHGDLVSWWIRHAKNTWIGIETRTWGNEYLATIVLGRSSL